MERDKKKKEREIQRKGESRRQASEAQRGKERQRARARDKKKQRRHFLLEKQHENFAVTMRKWEMLATTKVKMSACEKKKNNNNNTYDIPSIKRAARNFLEFSLHIVVCKTTAARAN